MNLTPTSIDDGSFCEAIAGVVEGVQIVKLLLNRGADVGAKDKYGKTALALAANWVRGAGSGLH